MEETIQAELKKQTIQEWIKTPLKDVVGVISQQHKIPIKIDVKALQDKNLTPDLKITANSKGTTLRQALQSMLRDTGLTYVVKDGVLMITTRDAAKRKSESKSPTPNAK
jgi:CMP-N-acetylneuraminic acid synthetase